MDKRTNKKISSFISEVATKNKNIIKVYLFGSYAKETSNKDSDIDLCFVIDSLSENDRFDLQVQLMLIASNFDPRIEPHPISIENFTESNSFASEIIKTGIAIEPKFPDNWYN